MQRTWVRILTTLMTVSVMATIYFFSTEPAEASDATSGFISIHIARMLRPEFDSLPEPEHQEYYDAVQRVVRKCAHFLEFLALGFSLRLCLESWLGPRKRLFLFSFLGAAGWAALDEVHQLAVSGRAGQPMDVMIDSAGAATGALLATALIWRILKKKRKEAPDVGNRV